MSTERRNQIRSVIAECLFIESGTAGFSSTKSLSKTHEAVDDAVHELQEIIDRQKAGPSTFFIADAECQLLLSQAIRFCSAEQVLSKSRSFYTQSLIAEACSVFLYHEQGILGWDNIGSMTLARVQQGLVGMNASRENNEDSGLLDCILSLYHVGYAGQALWERVLGLWIRNICPRFWSLCRRTLARCLDREPDPAVEALMDTIDCLQIDLAFAFHREADPLTWAYLMNNVGVAYTHRLGGSRAHNLEVAISYFHRALDGFTGDASIYERAVTLWNMADAFVQRIKGDHSGNLEECVACLKCALKLLKPGIYPDEIHGIQLAIDDAIEEQTLLCVFFGLQPISLR